MKGAREQARRPAGPPWRVGQGWDVHALVPGRILRLGGVTIPHSLGLLAHSDGDALLHAIADALLGAAGLGDLGAHFPDNDPRWAGADSGQLIRQVHRDVARAGWRVGNVDATVIAQAPRLAPHRQSMRAAVAQLLDLQPEQVNIKAKTAERFGAVGQGAAIEAHAIALLVPASP